MLENAVGLEAEFFLRNEKNELVMPKDHEFPYDDFILLGEIRGQHGKTREETISNFLKEYYRISYLAEKKKLKIDISVGWDKLDAKFYTSVIRKIEEKSISKCENIYGYDLLNYSDSIVDNGKIVAHKVSLGLHVHFSSINREEKKIKSKQYESVKLPLNISGANTTLNLFSEQKEEEIKLEVSCNRITKPAIRHIVEQMDKEIYPQFKIEEPLKYRMTGFYETKPNGRFEYRSLPFNENFLKNLPKLVDFSFNLLEGL
jgi:Txe/YoeB family toxin of Txe-Axe toxin-antitoxin module